MLIITTPTVFLLGLCNTQIQVLLLAEPWVGIQQQQMGMYGTHALQSKIMKATNEV
jgi:hypothetical protein